MNKFFFSRLMLSCCLLFTFHAHSQDEPDETEFRKGWVTYLNLGNGVVSNFQASPDLYLLGLQVNPQLTVVVHRLRVGANLGFVYTNKKLSGIAGPSLYYRLTSFDLKSIAGLANLHLIAEHNWGTEKQRLAGLGIGLEFLQRALVRITSHRDYHLNNWWIQAHIGLRLGRQKSVTPEFNR